MWAVATVLEVEGEPGHRLDRTGRVRARDGGAVGRRRCRRFARHWIYIVLAVARGRHSRVVRWVAKRPGEWHGLRQRGEAGEQERGWSQEWRRWRASPAVTVCPSKPSYMKLQGMLLGSLPCGGMGLDGTGWMTCPTTRCVAEERRRCRVATRSLETSERTCEALSFLELIDVDGGRADRAESRARAGPEQGQSRSRARANPRGKVKAEVLCGARSTARRRREGEMGWRRRG